MGKRCAQGAGSAGWLVSGFLLLVLVSVALAGCQTEPVGTGEFTTFGITSYKVDPDQVDAFVSAVHSDKMQQMGDDVSTMTSGYILRSMDDPETVIHVTFMNIQSEEDMAIAQASSEHPVRLEILEDVKPFLKEAPTLEGYVVLSELHYEH